MVAWIIGIISSHFNFKKKVILYNADGAIEKETSQLQTFEFSPALKGSIRNLNANGNKGFNFDGEYFYQFENDSIWQETDPNIIRSLTNSFYAAHYVICQPFSLPNENVILTYSGDEMFEESKVHVIDVAFKGDEKDADKWTYYFDSETFELVANKVIRTDHTSLIENLTFDTSTDFKFNATRKSYRLIETGERDYLRADYFYKNFEVKYLAQ